MAREHNYYSTAGCHPTRSDEFKQENYLENLSALIEDDAKTVHPRIVAIGECGLDYDRLEFCSKDQQMKGFIEQFKLAKKHNLPMFFHNRNTGGDFFDIVRQHSSDFSTGVVHSFDGSIEDVRVIKDLSLYIGINGW
jgi:TatD DNase family protein